MAYIPAPHSFPSGVFRRPPLRPSSPYKRGEGASSLPPFARLGAHPESTVPHTFAGPFDPDAAAAGGLQSVLGIYAPQVGPTVPSGYAPPARAPRRDSGLLSELRDLGGEMTLGQQEIVGHGYYGGTELEEDLVARNAEQQALIEETNRMLDAIDEEAEDLREIYPNLKRRTPSPSDRPFESPLQRGKRVVEEERAAAAAAATYNLINRYHPLKFGGKLPVWMPNQERNVWMSPKDKARMEEYDRESAAREAMDPAERMRKAKAAMGVNPITGKPMKRSVFTPIELSPRQQAHADARQRDLDQRRQRFIMKRMAKYPQQHAGRWIMWNAEQQARSDAARRQGGGGQGMTPRDLIALQQGNRQNTLGEMTLLAEMMNRRGDMQIRREEREEEKNVVATDKARKDEDRLNLRTTTQINGPIGRVVDRMIAEGIEPTEANILKLLPPGYQTYHVRGYYDGLDYGQDRWWGSPNAAQRRNIGRRKYLDGMLDPFPAEDEDEAEAPGGGDDEPWRPGMDEGQGTLNYL